MRKEIRREITEEQFRKATEEHDASGIFSQSECMYGIYWDRYYQDNGKYYVSFVLGDSCD